MNRPATICTTGIVTLFCFGIVQSHAQVLRCVGGPTGATPRISQGPTSIDDAGTVVFVESTADWFGANPEMTSQVVAWDLQTGSGSQLGAFRKGVTGAVSVSDDGQWVAFGSRSDPRGTNHDESLEAFLMSSDGATLSQLTSSPGPGWGEVGEVLVSGGGSVVFFTSNGNPLGSNAEHVSQIFAVGIDGTGLAQVSTLSDGYVGGLTVTDDGQLLAFEHDGDPLGGNADGSLEIYTIGADGSGLSQLTSGDSGASGERLAALRRTTRCRRSIQVDGRAHYRTLESPLLRGTIENAAWIS